MKLPANARKLKETAEEAGWTVEVTEDEDGEFAYVYDDGSENVYHGVPTLQVRILHSSVAMMAGWIKNPVSGRWMTVRANPVIIRTKDEDDYPNRVTYELNKAIGADYMYWEWHSVKGLMDLLETDDADMLAHRISRWGKTDSDDDDCD